MTGIVAGGSLGVLQSSLALLGGQGQLGSAPSGRNGERIYLNAATGNLVVQDRDEVLVGRGPDAALLRTYNSQGLLDGDNWRIGLYRCVSGLTGTVNTAGSTVMRTDADCASALYTYDSSLGKYVTTEGEGAYDTLSYDSGSQTWTWTDGTTGNAESYDDANGGRLMRITDRSGNAITLAYTGVLLTSVATADGETTYLDYTGNNLTQVRTVTSGSATLVRTRYAYDGSNRLIQVTTDLSPEDAAVADGNTYVTSYTYDGTSRRVATIAQTDGTALAFQYALVGADYRVSRITDALGHVTAISYNTTARTTTVTDPLGRSTVLAYDSSSRLTSVTLPAVNGIAQQTSYAYDASGNVTSVTDARGNAVVYGYDAGGNRTYARDAAGNVVERVYGSANEVLAETVYAAPDPDGAGAGQPAAPLTTRYVYDAGARLRFSVSAEGRVTEYRYDSFGQQVTAIQYTGAKYDLAGLTPASTLTEAQLAAWLPADRSGSIRIDTAYDFRGQVASSTTYAGVGSAGDGASATGATTQYVYDQAGNLLQRIDPRGAAGQTSYVYDGLGRLVCTTDALAQTTVTQYDDAGRRAVVTLANGLVRTSTYDAAGELIGVAESDGGTTLGETKYFYDADGRLRRTEDPTGVQTHVLYDEAGRKIADIDGTGALTEYRYDADNNLTRTIRYAHPVSAGALASLSDGAGAPQNIPLASIRPPADAADRSAWYAYDAANRLVKTVDAAGFVTENAYDGAGRVIGTVRFATAIATGALGNTPSAAAIAPAASPSTDRATRNFYDAEGKLLGTLDAEGYLVEYKYDAAGELVETIGYATATNASLRAAGTLDQLRPGSASADQHSYALYNARGQLAATVDAEGYLTESVYDAAGNRTQSVRYATKVTYTAGATLAALRPAADAADQASAYAYDNLDRVTSATAPDGTLTQYSYDAVGNLVRTVKAANTADARTLNAQYDKQGRLTAELSGVGSALLTGNQAQTEIDAIWSQYATRYIYDAAGRRTSATDPLGNRTVFYYDAEGRVAYTINALGEVRQSSYDALGQLVQVRQYGTRLSAPALATLQGGLADSAIRSAIGTLANPGVDTTISYLYDIRGELAQATDALGNVNSQAFDAFGEVTATSDAIGAQVYQYDRRGLRVQQAADPTGINAVQATQYDAFGRVTQTTDANGNVRTMAYDRLGRTVSITNPGNAARTTTYDAFSRVLTQSDALGNVTAYGYDTAARSVTVTTPEGVATTTVYDRHGETLYVIDGRGGVTTYGYDEDGNLTSVIDAAGLSSSREYDAAGQLIETIDGNGAAVRYAYDGARRVLSRRVDPDGLDLTTLYEYDAKGQAICVTDPAGITTRTSYDLKGQVASIVVDPGGLNLKTTFTYDARGEKLTVTEGADTAEARIKQYEYDALGRLARETVDPGAGPHLGLATAYAYDDNGNVVKKTDAAGNVTRYTYDGNDRLVHTIDALGGVAKNEYDADGRLVRTTAYATPISVAGLFDAASPSDVDARISMDAAHDEIKGYVYDRDGRELFCVDALGFVTQKTYDANGNLVRKIEYANAIPPATALTAGGIGAVLVPGAADRVTRTVYDAANRAAYSVDAEGYVTERRFDGLGHEIRRIRYAGAVAVDDSATSASLAALLPATPPASAVVEEAHYDNAGRLLETIDGAGVVTHNVYDASGNKTDVIRAYGTALASTTHYRYDAAGRELEETAAFGTAEAATTRYALDALGNRIHVIDPRGVALAEQDSAWAQSERQRLGYGAQAASLTSVERSSLLARYTSTQSFDAAGRTTATTDALGNTTRTVYDANGNAVKITDPRGHSGYFYYAADGKVRFHVDPLGYVTENRYDAFGNVTEELHYANALTGTYDETTSVQALAQAIAPSAGDRSTSKVYDRLGRVTTITYQGTPANVTETFVYDAFGNKTQYKDKNDAVFNYEYDARNLLVRELAPETEVVTAVLPSVVTQSTRLSKVYEYDAFGNRTRMVEAFGLPAQRETRYFYDALGRQTRVESPAFSVLDRASGTSGTLTPASEKTYDAAGNVVMETSPDGSRVLSYYDASNRKIASVDADNVLREYEYDPAGNLTRERTYDTRLAGTPSWQARPAPSDPAAYREMRYGYDANNLRTSTETRSETLFSYTLLESTGQGYYDAPVRTYVEYNANGDAVRSVDGNGNSTFQFYDALGNHVLQVDPLGYVTAWEYNSQGQVVRETRYASALPAATLGGLGAAADPQALRDAVAPSGQPENPNDRVTEYVYDSLGRVIIERKKAVAYATVNATNGQLTQQLGDLETRYEYDGAGNQTAVVLPGTQGRTDYTYDALGRRLEELKPQFQAFNGHGQALVATREETRFAYDAYGNVAVQTQLGLTAAENRETRTARDSAGLVRTQVDPEGATVTYDYDIRGNAVRRNRQVVDVDGTAHLYRTYYTYDALGREVSHQDIADEGTAQQVVGESEDTRYNAHGDIAAKGKNGQFQEQYRYDRLGRLFWTNNQNGTPRLYLYDANGNAVLEIHAIDTDLGMVDGPDGPIPVTSPAQVRLFSPLDVQMTVSRYDARNQLTDVFQPPMEFADLVSMAPVVSGTGTAGAPAETLSDLSQYQPVASSQMTHVGGETHTGGTAQTVLSDQTTTTTGYGTWNDSHTAQNVAVPLSELGLTAGTTTVVQPPVVDAPVTVISADGATKTVTERVTQTTVTTEVTVQADQSVLKKVTTTVDVVDRVTTFTRQVSDSYGMDDDSLETVWTLDKQEELSVDRQVNTKTDKITRLREVDAVGSLTGTEAIYPGTLAYTPPGGVSVHVDYIYQWVTYYDAEYGTPYSLYQFTGRMNVYVTVPQLNYYGTGLITVTDTWENGSATLTATTSGGTVVFNIRYDGHGVNVYKGGVHLASIGNDRSWPDNSAPLLGGASVVSIRGQNPAAHHVVFTSRQGTQTLYGGSYEGGIEFDAYNNLANGDWYTYDVYDANNNLLNSVHGTIGGAAQHQYQVNTRTRVTQIVQSISDDTQSYEYVETASSRLQNNYLRNLSLQVAQGGAESHVIHRQQSYDAFGEIVAEIDGRGNRTDLAYNDLGKLVRKEDPTTDVSPETGAAIRARPTTQYFYDELGRQVGTQDPDSFLKPAAEQYFSTQVLVNGRVEREFDAFGNSKRHVYDRLGNERLETSEIGLDTESQYDRDGRLTRVIQYDALGAQHASDSFEYDSAGNRIAHTNALGSRETYLFDGEGRIRRQTSFAGRQTVYDYSYVAGIGGIGGYEKRTVTAGVSGQDVATDRYDYFGNIRYHQDLGGHEFNYFYNAAGWLKEQTGTTGTTTRNAQHVVYDYYRNGYLKSISDTGINSYAAFQYDQNGNRTVEAYSQAPLGSDPTINPYQIATAEYDELNRVKRVRDDARFDIHYTYDANGNRRSIESTYFDLLSNTTQQQNFYYRYDRMNRFVTTMGERDAAGHIVRGTAGYDVFYDAAGRRMRVDSDHLEGGAPVTLRETYTYDPIGTVRETQILDVASGRTRHTLRENDAAGRLVDYREFDFNGSQTSYTHYGYDTDNLQTLEEVHNALEPGEYQSTQYTYAGNGILSSTLSQTIGAPDSAVVTLNYAYEKWDSYKESTITISATAANVNGWKPGSSTYKYDSNGHILRVYDSQADRTLDYVNNAQGQVLRRAEVGGGIGGGAPVINPIIRRFYSLNGVVLGDVGTDEVPSRVDYAQTLADHDRQAVDDYVKRHGESTPLPRSGGTEEFLLSLLTRGSTRSQISGGRDLGQRVFPVTSADFDQNYQPINNAYPAHAPGSYVTRTGDSLQSIAAALWGDSSLWYLLADANGLSGNEQLAAGTRITVPNVVTNVHNNSETFRPYDPGLAMGDTTPTLPDPPPPPHSDDGCGGFAQILVIVVVVIVTIYTAGAAAAYLSTTAAGGLAGGAAVFSGAAVSAGALTVGQAMAAAAIGGAVGSIAGQAVGMATGIQDKFSWSQVATSAIGAGVSAGVASYFAPAAGTTQAANAARSGWQLAGQAAVGNVATQAANMLLGQQSKFSWRSVAASAIAAPISSKIGAELGAGPNADFGRNAASGIAGGLVGYAAQRAAGVKNKVDFTSITANAIGQSLAEELAADSFGNSMGSALVGQVNGSQQTDKLDVAEEQSLGSGLRPGATTGLRVTPTAVAAFDNEVKFYDNEPILLAAGDGYEGVGREPRRTAGTWLSENYAGAVTGRVQRPEHMALMDGGGFWSGVGHSLFEAVYQPLAMVYDIEQAGYETARSVVTGQAPRDINFTSALGQAAADGAGTADILVGGLKGAVMTPVRLGHAIGQGDAFAAGNELTNLGLLVAGGVGGADSAITLRMNSVLVRDLAKQDFVYRAVPERYLDYYRATNRVMTPEGEPTYFSLEAGATPLEHKGATQLKSAPEVLLKIPVSALESPSVPRPNFGDGWFGREYKVTSYPEFGSGGYRQFIGTTRSFSEDWIVRGWGSK